MRTEVKNKYNVPIGWCTSNSDGDITAMHYKTGFVGRYSKMSNLTFDKRGSIFCYGDGTQTLIRDEEREVNG